jgi:hypothetical protein
MEGSGPFTRWFDDPKRKDDPPPSAAVRLSLAKVAVQEARDGAKVGWIVVDGAGVRTSAGIGVGSLYQDVQRAYPSARLAAQPPTFGRDSCVMILSPMQRVQAFFNDCRAARAGGTVTRLVVMPPEKK